MRTDQPKARLKISGELLALKVKWAVLTLIQLTGLLLVLTGGFPIFAPFIESFMTMPEVVSQSYMVELDVRSVASIAVGSILIWLST